MNIYMNKWQKKYCDEYCGGKKPRSKSGLAEFNMLGNIKDYVIVNFPDFNGENGFTPAHTETYKVTLDDCDIPNGKISVTVLASNLTLWASRGYTIQTK